EGDAAVAGFLGDPGGGLLAGVVRGGGHVGGPRGRDGVVVGGVRGRRGGGRYRHGRRERGGFGGRCCGGRGLGAVHRGLHASRTRPGRPAAAGVAFGTARVSRRRRRNRDCAAWPRPDCFASHLPPEILRPAPRGRAFARLSA